MSDYTELIKALRCKRDDCEGCDLAFFDKDEGWICQYAAKDDDAAAAIEELEAQLPKRGEMKNADKIRAMSDEELARWVVDKGRYFGEEYEGYMSCLDWLKEEVQE